MIQNQNARLFLAAGIGALIGGVFTIMLTEAIPKMMSEMTKNMMNQMQAEGCSPSEI